MSESNQEIKKLVEILSTNRESLFDMLEDLREFRTKLDVFLPKNADFKNKFIWEERVKTITNLISSELSIRKHIDDSVKNEVALREKMDKKEDDDSDGNIQDVAERLFKIMKTQKTSEVDDGVSD